MNILAKVSFVMLISGTLLVAACTKNQPSLPTTKTQNTSESALLDTPEEDMVPREITTKQVLPVETPEPAQTLQIQNEDL